jgi:hypothetical protein
LRGGVLRSQQLAVKQDVPLLWAEEAVRGGCRAASRSRLRHRMRDLVADLLHGSAGATTQPTSSPPPSSSPAVPDGAAIKARLSATNEARESLERAGASGTHMEALANEADNLNRQLRRVAESESETLEALRAEAEATAAKAMPTINEMQDAALQLSKVVAATESMLAYNQAVNPINFLTVVESIAAKLAAAAETKASDAFLDAESTTNVADSNASLVLQEAPPVTPARRGRLAASSTSPASPPSHPHEGKPSRRARIREKTFVEATPLLSLEELRQANRTSGLDPMSDPEGDDADGSGVGLTPPLAPPVR